MDESPSPQVFVELWVGSKVPKFFGMKSVLFRAGEAGTRSQVEALATQPGAAPLFGVLVRNSGLVPVALNSCRIGVFHEGSVEDERSVQITLNGWRLPAQGEKTWEFDGYDVFDLIKNLKRRSPDLDQTIQAIAELDGGNTLRSENTVSIVMDE